MSCPHHDHQGVWPVCIAAVIRWRACWRVAARTRFQGSLLMLNGATDSTGQLELFDFDHVHRHSSITAPVAIFYVALWIKCLKELHVHLAEASKAVRLSKANMFGTQNLQSDTMLGGKAYQSKVGYCLWHYVLLGLGFLLSRSQSYLVFLPKNLKENVQR